MLDFFERCKELHMQVMRAIALGIGIEETWFDSFVDVGNNTLRLLHYPEVKSEVFKKNKNQVRAGAHVCRFNSCPNKPCFPPYSSNPAIQSYC